MIEISQNTIISFERIGFMSISLKFEKQKWQP